MPYTVQIPSQLASHLLAFRKEKGLTQAELAKRLGLSQTRIARIEGDPLSVSVRQLLQVLSALGVRISLESLPTNRASAVLKGPMRTLTAAATAGSLAAPPTAHDDGEDW